MNRPLILGPAERASIQEVVTFAARPENHWRPLAGQATPPGGKEKHRREFGLPGRAYRCVYSITEASNGQLFRHLSIAIPEMQAKLAMSGLEKKSVAPNPIACWTLATAYGFTGWDGVSPHPPLGWAVDLPGFCVAIIQPYAVGA